MKIFNIISGLNRGGAETLLYNFIINDFKNTHIIISLSKNGYYKKVLLDKNYEVYDFETDNFFKLFSSTYKIFKILKKHKPNILQTWLYKADFIGSILSLFTNIKLYWSLHHSKPQNFKINIKTRFSYLILSIFSFVFPNKIFCCGKEVKLFHSKIGYKRSKLKVIFNGYDINKFNLKNNNKYLTKLSLNNKMFILGTVARWDKYKDFQTLFKSLNILDKHFKNWRLIIAGSNLTNKNNKLRKLIEKNNIIDKVLAIGEINDVENLYKIMSLNLLISKAEGFPNVLAESMLSGVPCIATDVGDNKLIISEYGMTVKPNDYEDLANKISNFILNLSNKNQHESLKKECRKTIMKNYSLEKMIKNYNEYWLIS